MQLPPHLLASFVAVADCRSYTRAAKSTGFAQPTVYQHVRQLEGIVGHRLVDQDGKTVLLTSHGRLVYDHARRILLLGDELDDLLGSREMLRHGHIRIGAPTTAGDFLVPHLAAGFQRAFPDVTIDIIVINNTGTIDRLVHERLLDVGVHSNGNREDGILKIPFLTDHLVCIARPDLELRVRPGGLHPDDLAPFEVVLFSRATRPIGERSMGLARVPIRDLVDDWFAKSNSVPNTKLQISSLEGIKSAVRSTNSVGIVSQVSVRPDDQSLKIHALCDAPTREFYLVKRQSRWDSPILTAFTEHVREIESPASAWTNSPGND